MFRKKKAQKDVVFCTSYGKEVRRRDQTGKECRRCSSQKPKKETLNSRTLGGNSSE